MSRQKLAGATIVLALLVAGCDGATVASGRDDAVTPDETESEVTESDQTADPTETFTVTVTTDRPQLAPGEEVAFTVEVCNTGPATTTEGGGGSDIPFNFRVEDADGRVVADDSHRFRTLELREVRWRTGECRQGGGRWDGHHWNRPEDQSTEPPDLDGTPVVGDPVPAGEYVIRVTGGLGTATSEPVRVVEG